MDLMLNRPGIANQLPDNCIELNLSNEQFNFRGLYPYYIPKTGNDYVFNIPGSGSATLFKVYFAANKDSNYIDIICYLGKITGNSRWWSAVIIRSRGGTEYVNSVTTGFNDFMSYLKSRYASIIPTSDVSLGYNYTVLFPMTFMDSEETTPCFKVTILGILGSNPHFTLEGTFSDSTSRPSGIIYSSLDENTAITEIKELNDRVDSLISKNTAMFVSR